MGRQVTDWGEINNLAGYHRVATDERDAASLSMRETSIDMSMVPSSTSFGDHVRSLLADGTLPESRIDLAAGRVLQMKKDVGLIADPFLSRAATNPIGTRSDRALSRRIAEESLVLLRNNVPKPKRGGGWSFSSETSTDWQAEYFTTTTIGPTQPAAVKFTVSQQRGQKPLEVDWGDGGPVTGNPANKVDNFAVRFTAVVDFPHGGTWRFVEHSDDLGSLTIDGVSVIAPYINNGGQHLNPRASSMAVSPGKHRIVYTFVEQGGAAWASLDWGQQPTGSEGWRYAGGGWTVKYDNSVMPLHTNFVLKDGVCSSAAPPPPLFGVPTVQGPARIPNCTAACSRKRYALDVGYKALDCDFTDVGVFRENTPADASVVQPYANVTSAKFSLVFETSIVTTQAQTWEFLVGASDDAVGLTVDGKVVWTAQPGPKHKCVNVYSLPASDPCNRGISDAVDNLMKAHPEWYNVNNVQLTREMGRETMHRHLHYRHQLGLDGGQACPLGPCSAGSQCTWDLKYHTQADPASEGSCAPHEITMPLSAGKHTVKLEVGAFAPRNHLSLSWRPQVVHTPILPIAPHKKVLLLGPSMDSLARLAGGWTIHWQGAADDSEFPPGHKTLFHAFKEMYEVGASGSVQYMPSVDITGTELTHGAAQRAIGAAKNADVVIIAFGEKVYTEKPGDIDDLALPRSLTAFVTDVVAVGTPTVAVLIEGRPRLLNGCLDDATAVIWAGLPGPEGGSALASVLVGTTSPSGRLPLSYPRSQLTAPYPYWHYVDSVCNYDTGGSACHVEWTFGSGLSYATVKYSKLKLSRTTVTGCESLDVRVHVTNTHTTRSQQHSVLLFLRDDVRSVTPEDKRLRGFEKVLLMPQQETEVRFTITAADYSFYGIDISRGPVAELGAFTVLVGPLVAKFKLVGDSSSAPH
jgi:hypothetical protein